MKDVAHDVRVETLSSGLNRKRVTSGRPDGLKKCVVKFYEHIFVQKI
jgi:hypothetical protein